MSSGDLTHGVCMNPTNISTSCSTYTKQKIKIISWGVSLVTITYKSTQLYWFTSSKCCVNVVTVIMNMTFSRQPEVTYHERTWLTTKAVIIKSKKRNRFVTFSRKDWIPMQFGIQKEGWLGLFSVNGGLICFHSILSCSLYMNKTWVTHNTSTLSEGV